MQNSTSWEDFDIISLAPEGTPERMFLPWMACLVWAFGEPEVVDAFRRDTGNQWEPGYTSLSMAIDRADLDFLKAFVHWVNVNIWGPVG